MNIARASDYFSLYKTASITWKVPVFIKKPVCFLKIITVFFQKRHYYIKITAL